MKISPRIKRMFNFINKAGSNQDEARDVPCDEHLYSNFYFHISPRQESCQSGNSAKHIKLLTEENVKKIPRLKRSKSVEDWLNDIDDGLVEDSQATELAQIQPATGELHYACVDVTSHRGLQSKHFASSTQIFRSYSSFSTFRSSSDSSGDFLH